MAYTLQHGMAAWHGTAWHGMARHGTASRHHAAIVLQWHSMDMAKDRNRPSIFNEYEYFYGDGKRQMMYGNSINIDIDVESNRFF